MLNRMLVTAVQDGGADGGDKASFLAVLGAFVSFLFLPQSSFNCHL